jgi:DinB superfamily
VASCYAPHATLATMTTNDLSTDLDRIADLRAAYAGLEPRVSAGEPWPLAADFGTGPEASWGPREVLAHVVEMLPFWLGELERVVEGGETMPVPFGRTADDPSRLGMIERERTLPLGVLFARLDAGLAAWAARLPSLTDADRAKVGLHPRSGEMPVAALPDRFAIGHAEDHVAQLERTLADAGR